MTIQQNKIIMYRLLDEVWNQGKLEVVDEIMSADHTSPSAPFLPPGPEGTKIIVNMFRKAMPDYHLKVDLIMADEHKVVARFTQHGTHSGEPLMGMPPSGRRAEWTEIAVLEIKDGKIVKSWYETDMLAMVNQLNPQN
ncbi:MAG: ester cyclase [Chloroflexi bacterium]|uniref:ester cyclase n=1 Tax=Candidatus Flexifilum breve TaxID=3140694 RepID=UPI0031364513|nr:ester cyclase [Chloroflexota bacterium]